MVFVARGGCRIDVLLSAMLSKSQNYLKPFSATGRVFGSSLISFFVCSWTCGWTEARLGRVTGVKVGGGVGK